MPKQKISEFNSNPALNTDIDSINIAEGCSPSGINDAIRELMSQLKDWQSGTSNDPYVVGSSGSLTLNQGTANGVAYLNGSKVVTSGSALTFDGTNFATTGQVKSTLNGISFLASGSTGQNLLYSANNGTQEVRVGIAASNLPYIGTISNDSLGFLQNGTEQMRLTSTGLGIGTSSPAARLSVVTASANSTAATIGGIEYGGSKRGLTIKTYQSAGGDDCGVEFNAANGLAGYGAFKFAANTTTLATLDSSGNLGLGVTPSAWNNSIKALQVNNAALASFTSGGNVQTWLANNAYYDNATGWLYKNSSVGAALYAQSFNGSHNWNIAPSGTAGNAITFTQAMTLNASGNLGVGTTSPDSRLTVYGGEVRWGDSSSVGALSYTGGAPVIASIGANPLLFFTNSSERARIDSDGNLLVGNTNNNVSSGGVIIRPAGDTYCGITNANNTLHVYSTTSSAYRFYVSGGGTINATNTTITGISDQRLKENIRDLDDGLEKVLALKPRKFDWKEGKGADIKNARGFIAQEFETIFPDMIEEWLDSAPEGEAPYKAVNANLIPTLVKAIQEQQAIIESLKARLDAANL